jgi:hypothetical protein
MSQRSPKPRRHRGAAPHPRGADPGARWQILCDIDRNGAGARDSLTPDHKRTTAQFLSGFDEFAAGSEALSSRRSERPRTPPEEEDSCASKMLYLGDRNASDEICVRSRRSADAAGREEHNLVLTARLPAAVAIFDVIAGNDPPIRSPRPARASGPTATSGSSTRRRARRAAGRSAPAVHLRGRRSGRDGAHWPAT